MLMSFSSSCMRKRDTWKYTCFDNTISASFSVVEIEIKDRNKKNNNNILRDMKHSTEMLHAASASKNCIHCGEGWKSGQDRPKGLYTWMKIDHVWGVWLTADISLDLAIVSGRFLNYWIEPWFVSHVSRPRTKDLVYGYSPRLNYTTETWIKFSHLICLESALQTSYWIDHFTVVCPVTWPLDGSEARVDLVLIQTLLLLSCKCT